MGGRRREDEELARLREEVARLRRSVDEERSAGGLGDALRTAMTAHGVASSAAESPLVEKIVQTAASVIPSCSASLLLLDDEADELVFEVALGPEADAVKSLRVPLGHGIAGLVAVSGQPLAVSDASNDPRQAKDIAQSVGYLPGTILCVPVIKDEEVVGVLELLDRAGGSTYSPSDITTLGFFADQVSAALGQSGKGADLSSLLAMSLEAHGWEALDRASSLVREMEGDPEHRRALELASLVREITGRGEEEYRACREILEGFAAYLRTKPESADDLEDFGDFG